jgi:hypothetical protein
LEKGAPVTIAGKDGTSYNLTGTINAWEMPAFYNQYPEVGRILGSYMINDAGGHNIEYIEEQIEQLESQAKRVTDEGQMQKLQQAYGQLQEQLKQAQTYQGEEKKRLADSPDIDILLTHKAPNNKKARPDSSGSQTSEITYELAQQAKATYAGHFEDGQIGDRRLTDLVATLDIVGKGTTTIDGIEVPIIYGRKDEPVTINPGSEYFAMTTYNANKEVEEVVIFRFIYE